MRAALCCLFISWFDLFVGSFVFCLFVLLCRRRVVLEFSQSFPPEPIPTDFGEGGAGTQGTTRGVGVGFWDG